MSKEAKKVFVMIVAIVAVTALPYLKEGLCAYFPDLMYHLLRTEGVKGAILEGEYPARIYTNFFNGYGYGSPMFYPDVFLLLPVALRILSVSPLVTWKVFALIITITASLTTYFSIKYIIKDAEWSMAGTVMLMLSQFYLADLHLRAGISEYIAFIFIPILFAGIYDFFACEGKKTYLMGIAFVGLLLSHSIMTFLGVLITVVIFIRMLFVKKENNFLFDKVKMCYLLCTAIGTLLITAYYWMPMLEQMSVLELRYSEPWADIGKYTQSFSDFFRITGTFSTIAYIGIGIPILPLTFLCFFLKKPANRWARAFFWGGIVLYLIMTDLMPWKLLEKTVLNMLQFTYRFYPYALFFSVTGVSWIMSENFGQCPGKYKKTVVWIVIGCAVLAGAFQNRMTAGIMSEESKAVSEEYLVENSNFVGAGEWLPLQIESEVLEGTASGMVYSDTEEEIHLYKNQKKYYFQTNGKAVNYTVPLIYYKGYQAWLESENGDKKILSVTSAENGLIEIEHLAEEKGTIYVTYSETGIQKISAVVSGIVCVGSIFYFLIIKAKRREKRYGE